ncbi:integrase catalytic domain-containing protein [Trichonephila clavipes]|nr:integrase catalytic domain-containing protein [Trichonephila clavipes]
MFGVVTSFGLPLQCSSLQIVWTRLNFTTQYFTVLRGGKKTNMTETSDISKSQTSENQLNQPHQLIAFDPNNSMQYEVGQLRGEPERIILKSDLPVHLRPYRNSPIQEKEIKGQVEKLLQAGLIKEVNSPYSAPVILAFKHDEAHHPQTNGTNGRVNPSLVTRLKCKVNASSTTIPWTKRLDQVCNEYNSTPHSIPKYSPAYLLFGLLPYLDHL